METRQLGDGHCGVVSGVLTLILLPRLTLLDLQRMREGVCVVSRQVQDIWGLFVHINLKVVPIVDGETKAHAS
jgi:hypothetical protein